MFIIRKEFSGGLIFSWEKGEYYYINEEYMQKLLDIPNRHSLGSR